MNEIYPNIKSIRDLSIATEIPIKKIAGMIFSSENHYRIFSLPKRNSDGVRVIHSPYPNLYKVQRFILEQILRNVDGNNYCYSYKSGVSIKDNAMRHIGTKVFYKIDLENFFENIGFKKVIRVFRNCGYSDGVSYMLTKLCLCNNGIPQGAPTSPLLSNIVTSKLDKRLSGLSTKENLTYSRYADDLFFSGEYISTKCRELIKTIVEQEGLIVNNKKELLVIGYHKKKIVTGLSVTEKNISLTRNYKRELRLNVYKYLKYNHKVNPYNVDFDPLYKEKLLGQLYFWKFIEEDNEIPNILIEKVRNKEIIYPDLEL
ncbi:MAG: reverse transcriptase family protein [Bacteriodetes bacterium]|nr:reverse transcriptase family protein [Bacteroidota bacterium]